LQALLNFRQKHLTDVDFLKWEARENQRPAWWLKTTAGSDVKLGTENFTFEVAGRLLIEDEEFLRPYWRKIHQQEVSDKTEAVASGLCLITGETDVPIAPTHNPKIKGVPNAQPTGAAIVSFDKPAFTSYGCDQSYNAPASIAASTAYSVALNWLLNQRNHYFRLGGTIICFWARDVEEATDIFAELFEQPKPETVQRFLTSPLRGAEHYGVKPDEFYSVTLAGNAGRIVVRHWMQCSLDSASDNLKRWFEDLQITAYGEVSDDAQPFSLYNLAKTTVRVKKVGRIDQKDLQPELLTQLYRAALEGHAPSLMLLKPILNHFAKELVSDGPHAALRRLSRFALLRLILNRQLRKEGKPEMEAQVFETDDYPYNCGRLLAIFDDLQREALSTEGNRFDGAGVVEKYYGSASSAPNSAFGILWRLHQHHLKKVSQKGDKGKAAAFAIKRKIAEIAALFPQPAPLQPPQFPRTFNLQEQGRFALGFYQQKAADDAARRAHRANNETLNNQSSTGQ